MLNYIRLTAINAEPYSENHTLRPPQPLRLNYVPVGYLAHIYLYLDVQ
jgi:hypothetical protein